MEKVTEWTHPKKHHGYVKSFKCVRCLWTSSYAVLRRDFRDMASAVKWAKEVSEVPNNSTPPEPISPLRSDRPPPPTLHSPEEYAVAVKEVANLRQKLAESSPPTLVPMIYKGTPIARARPRTKVQIPASVAPP